MSTRPSTSRRTAGWQRSADDLGIGGAGHGERDSGDDPANPRRTRRSDRLGPSAHGGHAVGIGLGRTLTGEIEGEEGEERGIHGGVISWWFRSGCRQRARSSANPSRLSTPQTKAAMSSPTSAIKMAARMIRASIGISRLRLDNR
jgi:hypothetical protein